MFFFKVSAEKKFKLTERIARKVYVLYFLGILQHWNAQWRHVLWWKRPFYVRVVLICLKITYIPSNVQGACWRTVTLLRSNHEGHKQHSMLSDWPLAQFRVNKRSRSWFPSYFLTVIATAITAGRCVGCIKWCIAQWKFQMLLRRFYLQCSNKSRFRQRIEVLRRARCSAPGKINRMYLVFDVYHM